MNDVKRVRFERHKPNEKCANTSMTKTEKKKKKNRCNPGEAGKPCTAKALKKVLLIETRVDVERIGQKSRSQQIVIPDTTMSQENDSIKRVLAR